MPGPCPESVAETPRGVELRIQLVDLRRPVGLGGLALHLHRRRQLARLDRELARQQSESLDALEPRELAIERPDDLVVERDDVVTTDQLGPLCRRTPQVLQAALQGSELG